MTKTKIWRVILFILFKSDLNLEEENQKLSAILHSMIGTQTVQQAGVIDFDDETPTVATETKPTDRVREETIEGIRAMGEKDQANEMQSLFDDKNVSSFSLFNFLPSQPVETPAQESQPVPSEQPEEKKYVCKHK